MKSNKVNKKRPSSLNSAIAADTQNDMYSNDIFNSLREPILVLDNQLQIKFANTAFYKTFYVTKAETEGVLVYELGNHQWNIPELRKLLENILPEKLEVIDFEITHNFQTIGQRTMQLNAREIFRNKEDGRLILLAIEDITMANETGIQNSLYSGIINSTYLAIISKTLDGNIISWNKGAEIIFGYTAKEIIGKNIGLLIPPELNEEAKMFIEKIRNDESINNQDTIRLTKEGKRINISVAVSPIKDKYGNIVGASKIAHDVTAQLEGIKQLEVSEAFNRTVLENSPDCVKIIDAEGRLQFMNTNGLCIMEIDDFGAFKNKPWPDLWGEENKHLVNEAIAKALTGKTAQFQAFCKTAKGTPKWWDVMVSPVLHPGTNKVQNIISVSTDITEHKEIENRIKASEAKYRSLFSSIDDGFCVIDVLFDDAGKASDYRFLETNPAFVHQTGLQDAVGRTMNDFTQLEDFWYKTYGDVAVTGKPVRFENRAENLNRFYDVYAFKTGGADERKVAVLFTDVTQRKLTEIALQESETRFQNLVRDSSAAIIVLTGTEMKVEIVNKAYGHLLERTPDELLGKPLFSIVPDAEAYYLPILEKVRLTGETLYLYDSPYSIKKDDKIIEGFLHVVYQPYGDSAGNIIGVMIIIQDVTEQVISRRKVEESEERYHNLVYSSPSAIGILKGRDLIITAGNDAIFTLWGKGRDIIGQPYFSALPELAEQGYREVFNQVYTTGIPFNAVETPVYINQDGITTLKYYNFILYPQRNANGDVEGIGIIATEVTSQAELNKKVKESEENFRQLAELMPGLVSTADAIGNVNFYSKNWEIYTGITRKELVEKGWAMLMHPQELDTIGKRWQHSVETGDDFEIELRLKNKTNDYKWHLSRAAAVKNSEGKVIKWIGSMTEIQIQKEKREELENAVTERTKELSDVNTELVKMNKELESFTYIASHDLQEPLRKIQTFSTRILDTDEASLSQTGKEYFRRMLSAAQRMQTLIEDLLTYSQSSNTITKHELVDLDKIEEEIKEEFADTIKEKNASVQITGTCQGCINASQFSQVVLNLLGNSLKFASAERLPEIIINNEIIKGSEVKNAKLIDGKLYCHISFTDNGIGFDPKYEEQIFQVFQRLHGKEEYKGTGIGLAIVKKIVENHHGIITAKGDLGKGARFDIFIPTA